MALDAYFSNFPPNSYVFQQWVDEERWTPKLDVVE